VGAGQRRAYSVQSRIRPPDREGARHARWHAAVELKAELAVIGTPASTIGPDQLAYASKEFLEFHKANQSFFLKRPEVVDILKNLAAVARTVTRDMAAARVGILAGCDGLIAGFCLHDELATMVQSGLTPLAALQTATINPARYLGREATLGTVAPGRSADLVLLDANPLEDIANVRRVRSVIAAGRLLDRNALDRLLSQAKAAAQK
jgi:hypothetical protein